MLRRFDPRLIIICLASSFHMAKYLPGVRTAERVGDTPGWDDWVAVSSYYFFHLFLEWYLELSIAFLIRVTPSAFQIGTLSTEEERVKWLAQGHINGKRARNSPQRAPSLCTTSNWGAFLSDREGSASHTFASGWLCELDTVMMPWLCFFFFWKWTGDEFCSCTHGNNTSLCQ